MAIFFSREVNKELTFKKLEHPGQHLTPLGVFAVFATKTR
jgi:hypothetical protein